MINWQSLFFNSFWIVGLALLLAAFSYHYWVAQTTQLSLKEQLNTQPFQQLFWLSFVLVGIGLVGTSTTWWEMRLGIHSGPVMAGVIGQKKFAYDVWGDTVNVASRMETGGQTGRVNISEKTFEMVKDFFECQYRGLIQAKNHGELGMYFLVGIRPELSQDDQGRVPNEDFRKKVQTLGQLN